MHHELSDSDLLIRSIANPAAFAGIIRRHARTVHEYLSRRVGDEQAVALTLTTFSLAYARRERHQPRSASAEAWLLALATEVVSRNRRTELRWLRRRSADEDGPEQIHRAIAFLPAADRDLVGLRALAGLTPGEIATATGRTRERVERDLARISTRYGIADAPGAEPSLRIAA